MCPKQNKEYYRIVKYIIEHPEFIKRKDYKHHENESVYEHSVKVSILSYKIAKFLHLDKESTAIGGLLHDFYYKPWQTNIGKKKFLKQHGFVHAKEALDNSSIYFNNFLNNKTEDIIARHMFPLNIKPPKYAESWIVTLVDKLVSLNILAHPTAWPKYVGIKTKIITGVKKDV